MLQRRRRCGGAWRRLGRKGDLQASYKVLNCETRIWIRHFHDFCDHSCELQPRCRQNLLISWRETVSSRAVSSKDVWQFILRCPVDEAKSTFKMKGLVISLFSPLQAQSPLPSDLWVPADFQMAPDPPSEIWDPEDPPEVSPSHSREKKINFQVFWWMFCAYHPSILFLHMLAEESGYGLLHISYLL